MNFNLMTGYEFEEYIAKFFKSKGFDVQQTCYSHDGGIDLIAICNEAIFSGRYIIQCKKYTDSLVGQPAIRDLYGVVMSENANKGILITTSDFTEDAQAFAKHKNIELINGTLLAKIVSTDSYAPQQAKVIEGFNHDRYRYMLDKIGENPSDPKTYNETIKFLRAYVIENAAFIEQLSLYDKIIDLNMQLIKKCYKKKSDEMHRKVTWLKIAEMEILKGNIGQAVNILLDNNSFYLTSYLPRHVAGTRSPTFDTYKPSYDVRFLNIEARNLYSILKKLGIHSICDLILGDYSLSIEWENVKEHSLHSLENRGIINNPDELKKEFLWYIDILESKMKDYQKFDSEHGDGIYIFCEPYAIYSAYTGRFSSPPRLEYSSEKQNVSVDNSIIVKRYKKTCDEIQQEIELALKQHGIIL